jgi:hypothetical protein
MPREHEPNWNIEELTDAKMSAAVRYLDPGSSCETRVEDDSSVLEMYDSCTEGR